MLRAGIDIGTNTILLLIAEVNNGLVTKVVEDHVTVVRLGQGVDKNRAFNPEAMDRALNCFLKYAKILEKYPGIKVNAVATSGSRDAKNSVEFFENVFLKTGIKIKVISGNEEAAMSFLGALVPGIEANQVAVLDIGGGSTEIVAIDSSGPQKGINKHSFDMGCVRLTERFLKSDPASQAEVSELREYVKKTLNDKKDFLSAFGSKHLIAVAGTPTYISASLLELKAFDAEKIHGSKIRRDALIKLTERFATLTAKERIGIGGMDHGRADVIVAGAIILDEFMQAMGKQELEVSIRGLRFGAVLSE